MFHWADEFTYPKIGFNFYRWNDPASAGCKIVYYPSRMITIRYSKNRKRWFVNHIVATG